MSKSGVISCQVSPVRSWRQDRATAAASDVSSHSPDLTEWDWTAQAPKKKGKETLWKERRSFPPWLSRGWWGGEKNKVGFLDAHLNISSERFRAEDTCQRARDQSEDRTGLMAAAVSTF
jgi:hypothetical protein